METPVVKPTESPSQLENGRNLSFQETQGIVHDCIGLSPLGPRKIRRGLSNIIAEMRKDSVTQTQNQVLDFEMHVKNQNNDLNEIENFDHLGETKEKDNEIDTSNSSRPIYKKRGQKRTTRRHVFRPDFESINEPVIDIDSTKVSKQPIPQNYKRLKLHNSGFKGRPQFFKKK